MTVCLRLAQPPVPPRLGSVRQRGSANVTSSPHHPHTLARPVWCVCVPDYCPYFPPQEHAQLPFLLELLYIFALAYEAASFPTAVSALSTHLTRTRPLSYSNSTQTLARWERRQHTDTEKRWGPHTDTDRMVGAGKTGCRLTSTSSPCCSCSSSCTRSCTCPCPPGPRSPVRPAAHPRSAHPTAMPTRRYTPTTHSRHTRDTLETHSKHTRNTLNTRVGLARPPWASKWCQVRHSCWFPRAEPPSPRRRRCSRRCQGCWRTTGRPHNTCGEHPTDHVRSAPHAVPHQTDRQHHTPGQRRQVCTTLPSQHHTHTTIPHSWPAPHSRTRRRHVRRERRSRWEDGEAQMIGSGYLLGGLVGVAEPEVVHEAAPCRRALQ
eukprot:3877713-Rhodomonas_salina.1